MPKERNSKQQKQFEYMAKPGRRSGDIGRDQLYREAKKLNIKGRAKMSKAELAAALGITGLA